MAGARKSEIFSCGGQKREFTWQVQGIGHVVKIVAGAVFRGRCQNVGKRVSFEGLQFTWQAQGFRTMDPFPARPVTTMIGTKVVTGIAGTVKV